MDAVDQTAISKEDALPKVDGLTNASDDGGLKSAQSTCCDGADLKSDTVEANIAAVDGKRDGVAAVVNIENSDDLLEKIKKVVKEDDGSSNGNSAGENDVAQGSEQDFLKRLDEFEQETKNEELAESKKNEESSEVSVEECVTSSDEKETAGNVAAPDESDETVRAVSDNIVDSTSQELDNKVAEKPVQEEKEPESSEEITEIISSEDDESSSVQKPTEKTVSQSVVEISSDDGSDDVAVVEKSIPENSAISSACETIVEKDTSIEPPLKNGEVQQSSLEVDTTEPAVANELEESTEPKESVSDEPKALLLLEELASGKIENGEEVTEETKVTTEEPKEISELSAEVLAEKEIVEATSGSVEAETLPMSVDQSPENVDTMEIDEEENMDVDMTENISENDEEMATVEEEKTVAGEVAPTPEVTVIAEKSEEPKIIDETEFLAANEETVVAATSEENVNEKTEECTETVVAAKLHEIDAEKSKKAEEIPKEKEKKAVEILPAEVPIVPEKETATEETPKEVEPFKSNVVVEQKPPTKVEKAESPTKIAVSKVEPEKVIAEAAVESIAPKEIVESIAPKEIVESIAPKKIVESIAPKKIVESIAPKKIVESIAPKETVDEDKTIDKRKTDNKPDVIVEISDESNSMKNDQGESEMNADKLRGARVENKLLTSTMKHGGSIASLDGSPGGAASNANVFNSTPIQQQFEISSENVSKISEVNEQANRTSESAQLSKTEEESTEMGTTTTSESDHQTSDSVTKYLKLVKQCNGIAPEERNIPAKSTSKTPQQTNINILPADLILSNTDTDSISKKSQYEINLWFDEEDIRFLSIEKFDTKKSIHSTLETTSGGDSSEKLSSNGSVSSLPPFTLPNRVSEISSFSGSSLGRDVKPVFPAHVKRNKHTITGTVELCTFMIDQFTKIKEKFEPATESLPEDVPTTPKVKGRESVKKNLTKDKSVSPHVLEDETPTKKVDKRTLKRALNKTQSDDDDEVKPKSAKQVKTTQSKTPVTPSKSADSIESSVIGYCVLAKWIDKKYYAGKVIDAKTGNKFVILFEDGATKILPKESIVFGQEDVLPLKDQKVYALVDDDYERGLVKSFEKIEDKVIYTVDVNGKDVNVSASDIYLTDQQAKAIQNCKDDHSGATPSTSAKTSDTPTEKSPTAGSRSTRNKRQATSPITPEAGFSGGVTKRGRRQKRVTVQQTRISESSEISDSPDIVASPSSPESALEAIEGVQPELQKTPKESEISRMMIISDYMKQEPLCDIMQLLGPLPMSKTLFKNKYFLLTCTVGQKFSPTNSCTNNSPQFSTLPFIKKHLRKQIEDGGGTVYNHFEDIPKNKYKQCKLIASRPCTTAKYVQCLAADIQAISHEWVIEICKQNNLIDVKNYVLPSGWSIMNGIFVKWAVGKSIENRQNKKPLQKEIVLIASEHEDFVTFWSRVCKLAGATLRYIKSLGDVTPTTTGYMVTEQDFPQMIKLKAEFYGIPIVSTVWIVESLVLGKVCEPHSHGKFTQIYQDD